MKILYALTLLLLLVPLASFGGEATTDEPLGNLELKLDQAPLQTPAPEVETPSAATAIPSSLESLPAHPTPQATADIDGFLAESLANKPCSERFGIPACDPATCDPSCRASGFDGGECLLNCCICF